MEQYVGYTSVCLCKSVTDTINLRELINVWQIAGYKTGKIERLKELLPEVFTEEKIDWGKLKAALGEDVEFKNERYVLNWAGKSDAFKVLQSPTTATLAPDRNKSIDFDNTGNVFIGRIVPQKQQEIAAIIIPTGFP